MSDELFPPEKSAEILGELSSWTSIANIMVAARILEGRTTADDQPAEMLVMPLEREEPAFEQIFMVLVGHLINGYVVPTQKLAVCRALDPQITEQTDIALQSLRFRPTIRVGRVSELPDKRVCIVEDKPAVIEVIRAPLICLMGIFLDTYEFTKPLSDMVVQAEEKTGGRPTIFHRPYADACLPSFIEAACFYGLRLEVGTRFAKPGHTNIDNAYRSVNIQATPPVDPAILNVALESGQRMLNALR